MNRELLDYDFMLGELVTEEPKPMKKRISFDIPSELHAIIKDKATRQNRTITKYVIIALVEKLQREK